MQIGSQPDSFFSLQVPKKDLPLDPTHWDLHLLAPAPDSPPSTEISRSTDSFVISTKLHRHSDDGGHGSHAIGNCTLSQFEHRTCILPPREQQLQKDWLDLSQDYNQVCVETYGSALGSGETAAYCLLQQSGEAGLAASTTELHRMFLAATERVLDPSQQKEASGRFLVSDPVWTLLRRSWALQRDDVVAGRFDLSITSDGIKVYEVRSKNDIIVG